MINLPYLTTVLTTWALFFATGTAERQLHFLEMLAGAAGFQ